MKRTPMKPRKAPLRARVPIPRKARTPKPKPKVHGWKVRRKRKPGEFRRIYGSRARVEFVKYEMWCAGCLKMPTRERPNHNHHIVTGGMGRKAGYETIIPLCPDCHRRWHENGPEDFDPMYAAERTEKRWQAYSHPRKSA